MNLIMEILQILIPLALILWLWLAPAHSMISFIVQAAGAGLALLALSLISIWGTPPWWMPYMFGLIWMFAIIFQIRVHKFKFERLLPEGKGWMHFTAGGLLSLVGGFFAIMAIDGRGMPQGNSVSLAAPFGTGEYLVANGGSREIVNGHLRTLDPKDRRYPFWKGLSYAVDFFQTGPAGLHKSRLMSSDPASFVIFGTPVLAPCNGEVIASEWTLPDNQVPDTDKINKPGNFVFLVCQGNDILLAHLKAGSVKLHEGDLVKIGDKVGEVGNSGQSYQPHLHMHAQDRGDPGKLFSGTPLPMKIDGQFLVRNDLLMVDEK